MRAIAILTLCLPLMATANAQEGCASSGALQRYEDIRDNHISAIDELGDAEIELAKTAYGAIQSGVIKEIVRRTGAHKYGVNMLMPILGNAGNISDTLSPEPEVRLDGALGILNNIAWKFIQPLGMDDLAKSIVDGLGGLAPASPGEMQDRLNRMQLAETMKGHGCSEDTSGLPAYQDEGLDLYGMDYGACEYLDFSSMISPFDYEKERKGNVGGGDFWCDQSAFSSEDGRTVSDQGGVEVRAYRYTSVEATKAHFDELNAALGGPSLGAMGAPNIFSEESVGYTVHNEYGSEKAEGYIGIYRDLNLLVRVSAVVSADDKPLMKLPLSSASHSIAKQVFQIMWEARQSESEN
ncbi:hypothetical protein [Luteimonas salinilitoris]|uniref:Uncharacterized protein n=1 Tax=Luteimonas salinilitoris TaxID=3237697 RepID=A0ABV4HMX5_9GAMM